jgi:hypothetical protein
MTARGLFFDKAFEHITKHGASRLAKLAKAYRTQYRRTFTPLAHAFDIAAATKTAPSPRHQQHIDIISQLSFLKSSHPAGEYLRREGIQRLRPIQRHNRDLVLYFKQKIIRHPFLTPPHDNGT